MLCLRAGKGLGVLDVERRQQMVAFIEQNEGATVAGLKERFGVSDATVRRDLIQLSKQGYIERGHGGAVPRRFRRSQGLPELPVLERRFQDGAVLKQQRVPVIRAERRTGFEDRPEEAQGQGGIHRRVQEQWPHSMHRLADYRCCRQAGLESQQWRFGS